MSHPKFKVMLIATALSVSLHVWVWATSPKLLDSNFEFVVWPGFITAVAINSLLPSCIAVQYDPLPHPLVWWVAVPVNLTFWAVLLYGLIFTVWFRHKAKKL